MDEMEKQKLIKKTRDTYRIMLAMTLRDRCDKSPTWVNNCLNHIDKLFVMIEEGRLSVSDCRQVLIDEINLVIGDEGDFNGTT